MKKTLLLSFLLASMVAGIGISLLTPMDTYACSCTDGYPPASGRIGICRDGQILWGLNCTGRSDCDPSVVCHCQNTVCVEYIPCEWPCE